MIRYARIVVVAVLAGLCALEAGAEQASPGGKSEGQHLAFKFCAACHIVSPSQPDLPILRPPAPSFRAIAKRPGTTAQSVREFLLTTHKSLDTLSNMPNPELTQDQAASVADYLVSLKMQR